MYFRIIIGNFERSSVKFKILHVSVEEWHHEDGGMEMLNTLYTRQQTETRPHTRQEQVNGDRWQVFIWSILLTYWQAHFLRRLVGIYLIALLGIWMKMSGYPLYQLKWYQNCPLGVAEKNICPSQELNLDHSHFSELSRCASNFTMQRQ
jgi:hypothetical protein